MTQYISKAALIAEIERRIKGLKDCHADTVACYAGEISGLKRLLSFLDTFGVKKVDLEKVIEDYFKGWTDDYDNGGAACHYQYVQVNDCKAIARHFFELGLKATPKGGGE